MSDNGLISIHLITPHPLLLLLNTTIAITVTITLQVRHTYKSKETKVLSSFTQEGRFISRQNLNEYLRTLHLAPMQFCDFYRKTGFLKSDPFYIYQFYSFRFSN